MEGKYLELHRLLMWHNLIELIDNTVPSYQYPQFPVKQPLFLEIGFGNGEYLLQQAEQYPQHNFLGLELHWGSVRRCLRRLAQANIENVRLLQIDAQIAVHYIFPDQCLEKFLALFPCPWPKRNHQHMRLFSTAFMGQLHRICRQGGLVVTDHSGLVEFALAQVAGSGLEIELIETPARYHTKYERRWCGQGQQIFYELHYHPVSHYTFKKIPEAAVHTLTTEQFQPEHLCLQGYQEELIIKFQQELYDPKQEIFMVLVTVIEDQLKQTFWIEVARKPTGMWHIRPAQGGGFLPTIGVQKALELVQQAAQTS